MKAPHTKSWCGAQMALLRDVHPAFDTGHTFITRERRRQVAGENAVGLATLELGHLGGQLTDGHRRGLAREQGIGDFRDGGRAGRHVDHLLDDLLGGPPLLAGRLGGGQLAEPDIGPLEALGLAGQQRRCFPKQSRHRHDRLDGGTDSGMNAALGLGH